MGAYSLVARKAHMRLAEQLISTGEAFSAQWHYEQGLVNRLFNEGEGYQATRTFIDGMRPKINGIRAMLRTRRRVLPITKAELLEITEDWSESAFSLEEKDLAYMERLVMLQNKTRSKSAIVDITQPVARSLKDSNLDAVINSDTAKEFPILQHPSNITRIKGLEQS
jgi:DSF synthase